MKNKLLRLAWLFFCTVILLTGCSTKETQNTESRLLNNFYDYPLPVKVSASHQAKYICYKEIQVDSFYEYPGRGNEFVEWQSETLAIQSANKPADFIIACAFGINMGTNGVHEFFVNDQKIIDFSPSYQKELTWQSAGVKLTFHTLYINKDNDIFGVMQINLPAEFIKSGEPVKFRVQGKNSECKSWFMLAQTDIEKDIDINAYQVKNSIDKQLSAIRMALEKPKDTSKWRMEVLDSHPKYISSAHPENMEGETARLYKNWQELKQRKLSLLPVPKWIQFSSDTVNATQITVVVEGEKNRQGEIAANEIISRLAEFGIVAEPVSSIPQEGRFNIIIENRFPSSLNENLATIKISNNYCRDQAYCIEAVPEGLRLVGATPVGLMYAAVTVRFLIDKKDDEIIFHPAKIMDWPDFPRRMIIRLDTLNKMLTDYLKTDDTQVYIAFQKKIIDWAFRRKINVVNRHTAGVYYPTPFDKETWLASKEKFFERGKPLGDYMAERGMGAWFYDFMNFGTVEELQSRPELAGCSSAPLSNGVSYASWAYDDLHRAKAEKTAEFLQRCGYSVAYVHDHDNIAAWDNRDQATRKKYGDDRAAACIGMFKNYYEEFKKRNIEFGMVILPYHGCNFFSEGLASRFVLYGGDPATVEARMPGFGKQAHEYTEFIKQVSAGFPKDALLCVREGTRAEMLNFYNLCTGHPLFIYFQEFAPDDGGNSRFLPATIATYKTAFDATRNYNDLFAAMNTGDNPNVWACAAEYAWNTSFPGANESMRGYSKSAYALGANDPDLLDIMAERAAVGVWGHVYGNVLKNIMNSDFSLDYPFFNRSFKGNKHENYLENILANEKFLLSAETALDQAWSMENRESGEKLSAIIPKYFFEYFLALRNAVKVAKVFNIGNLACEQARILAEQDHGTEATLIIDKALLKLPEAVASFQKAQQEMSGKFSPEYCYRSFALNRIITALPGSAILKGEAFSELRLKLEEMKKNIAFNSLPQANSQTGGECALEISDSKIKSVTVTDGTGSFFSFKLSATFSAPVNNLALSIAVFDSKGEILLSPTEIFRATTPLSGKQIEVEKEINSQHDLLKVIVAANYQTSSGQTEGLKKEFTIGSLVFGKTGQTSDELLWLTFENETDLKSCSAFENTKFSLSAEQASEGKQSLKVSLRQSDKYAGGVNLSPALTDWSEYKSLKIDLFWSGETSIGFTLRLSDQESKRLYITKQFSLRPGWNKDITVDLRKLATEIDVAKIKDLLLYTGKQSTESSIYIDNVRLYKDVEKTL